MRPRFFAIVLGCLAACSAERADSPPATSRVDSRSAGSPRTGTPRTGAWCAELASPGGPLRFGMILRRDGDRWSAAVENGEESIAVPDVRTEDGELVLDFPHYDSSVRARIEDVGARLSGAWKKRSAAGRTTELPFTAAYLAEHSAPRCAPARQATTPSERFAGRYAVRFSTSEDPAVLVLTAADGRLSGTFLTTTGDYRYLDGAVEGDRLSLACFDGAHAFLFAARADGTEKLTGDFWSGDRHHETWTAVRAPDATLPDAFAQVEAQPDFALAMRLFPDLDDVERSLGEPAFAGRARIVQVLGSWCPNCHDETAYLADLDRRFRARGLSIVGLAFEYTDDRARSAEQVRRMRARHDARYPILLAGLADKAQAAQALPVLDRVLAFPTTIFLHGDGRVRAVHSGFAGPATGAEHDRLRAEFEGLVEELLAEEPANEEATWTLLRSDAWRDEGEGWLVEFALHREARRYEAREFLRFDRPQQRGAVAGGPVAHSGTTVMLGNAVWFLDRRAGVLLDPRDFGHRMVPGARPRIPVVDGVGVSERDELDAALESGDPLLRRETLHYLALLAKDGELEGEFDPLPKLADPDLGVRTMAAWACGHLALPQAEPGLIACLAHPNSALRREAARALAKIATPSAVAPLRALEEDLDPLVREAARAVKQ